MSDVLGTFRETLEFEARILGTPNTITISRALDVVASAYQIGRKESEEKELRKRYAGLAMQGIISDHQTIQKIADLLRSRGDERIEGLEKVVAERSVAFADTLIEALKKERK